MATNYHSRVFSGVDDHINKLSEFKKELIALFVSGNEGNWPRQLKFHKFNTSITCFRLLYIIKIILNDLNMAIEIKDIAFELIKLGRSMILMKETADKMEIVELGFYLMNYGVKVATVNITCTKNSMLVNELKTIPRKTASDEITDLVLQENANRPLAQSYDLRRPLNSAKEGHITVAAQFSIDWEVITNLKKLMWEHGLPIAVFPVLYECNVITCERMDYILEKMVKIEKDMKTMIETFKSQKNGPAYMPISKAVFKLLIEIVNSYKAKVAIFKPRRIKKVKKKTKFINLTPTNIYNVSGYSLLREPNLVNEYHIKNSAQIGATFPFQQIDSSNFNVKNDHLRQNSFRSVQTSAVQPECILSTNYHDNSNLNSAAYRYDRSNNDLNRSTCEAPEEYNYQLPLNFIKRAPVHIQYSEADAEGFGFYNSESHYEAGNFNCQFRMEADFNNSQKNSVNENVFLNSNEDITHHNQEPNEFLNMEEDKLLEIGISVDHSQNKFSKLGTALECVDARYDTVDWKKSQNCVLVQDSLYHLNVQPQDEGNNLNFEKPNSSESKKNSIGMKSYKRSRHYKLLKSFSDNEFNSYSDVMQASSMLKRADSVKKTVNYQESRAERSPVTACSSPNKAAEISKHGSRRFFSVFKKFKFFKK